MMGGDDVRPYSPVARVEVFEGAKPRRQWPVELKAQIVAESYATGVGPTALRHDLAKNQIFSWRREARLRPGPAFASVVVEDQRNGGGGCAGVIEVEIGSAGVRIPPGSDPHLVKAVLLTLKGGR